ncbi:MAG TPA: ThiF family adenylyltransferase [Thermoplasmata archaeon]|nr:ThiF family adenylyltransferase [Thermoplasmata archaeon]
MKENRYSRQILLPEIGQQGQKALSKSIAVVLGCGALGTHSLSFLARAGVGDVRVIDRDVVEESNLQRQTLFNEDDVGRAKAKVAAESLVKVNSQIKVTGIVADVTYLNVQSMVREATVVVDATDNMDTRFLLNDACVKLGIPWIYSGAVGTVGMVMPVVPDGPCLRCVFPSPPQPGELPTCDTVGIVNTLPAAIAAFAVTEAFKIMVGRDSKKELLVLDVWQNDIQVIEVKKNPRCTCCGDRNFEFLQAKKRKLVVSLCGRNAVQIVPSRPLKGGLGSLSRKLSKLGSVNTVDGLLKFKTRSEEITVFPDGRTIVGGTTDLSRAKTIFSKYVGD